MSLSGMSELYKRMIYPHSGRGFIAHPLRAYLTTDESWYLWDVPSEK
jgi:hypothetical protein